VKSCQKKEQLLTGLASTGEKLSKERATSDRFGFSQRKAVKRRSKARGFPPLAFSYGVANCSCLFKIINWIKHHILVNIISMKRLWRLFNGLPK
jgi:hypothetical protein